MHEIPRLSAQDFPRLMNDRVLRAARGEPVDKIPVWIMRQAGRHLPEFRSFRANNDFFKICDTPELAAEVTLMPIRTYDVDAAIIFSDILVIPRALGVDVKMVPQVGPVIEQPISVPQDLERLKPEGALDRLLHVGEAIKITRMKLNGKCPLFGFAGAPWTVMSYMIEGGGSKTLSKAKKWLYTYKSDAHKFLSILTNITIDYLVMQVCYGAQILQVFESNCEYLNSELFDEFLLPYLKSIPLSVKSKLNDLKLEMVPMVLFCKGGHFCLKKQATLDYDVIGIDWTVDPEEARKLVGENKTIQGNLDPCALYSNPNDLVNRTRDMVESFGKHRYIANLGHGIYPDASIESVTCFVEAIHSAFQPL